MNREALTSLEQPDNIKRRKNSNDKNKNEVIDLTTQCSTEELNEALFKAILDGETDTVSDLLEAGAEVNAKDSEGSTPLHFAAANEQIAAMKLLLAKGADIEAKDIDDRTALHDATANGQIEAIALLLAKGADIDAKDNDGCTPLHDAAANGQIEAMEMLLVNGAAIDAKDNDGNTPFHIAAANDQIEAMELLLAKGAAIDAADNKGKTSLHNVAERGQVAVTKKLLAKGAKVTVADIIGNTPLHDAAMIGNKDIIATLATEATEGLKDNRFFSRIEPNRRNSTALKYLMNRPELLRFNHDARSWEGELVSDRRQVLRDNSLYYLLDKLESQLSAKATSVMQQAQWPSEPEDVACKRGLGVFLQLGREGFSELQKITMGYLKSGPLTYTTKEDDKARRIAERAADSEHLFNKPSP